MPSPMHGYQPPYALPSNVVYFHDWRYVNTGNLAWMTGDGRHAPLFTTDPVPPVRYELSDFPRGVRLVARKAEKSGPVLTPEQAHAVFLFGGTIIRDGGTYRLWYECWPEEEIAGPRMGHTNVLRYAESDDGVAWRTPEIGAVEYRGSRAHNVVYGATHTGDVGFHGGSVFRDPSAPPSERYKAFHLGDIPPAMWEDYRRRRPHEIDPRMGRPVALYGATSPDGLHWTPVREPLVAQNSDTHNCCEYDAARGKYVAYCRSWFYGRRTIGRMESDDFRRFPLPEELFWPNAAMAPFDLWYSQPKSAMPGAPDYHVMFPMRWSLIDDSFTFHLATSPDGIAWGFVPDAEGRNAPVCVPGPAGAWDGGVVTPGIGLVELPGDRIGILLAGSPVPHKHPRKPPLGKLGWATWPKDRLVALEAPGDGEFALWPIVFRGRTARINARTHYAGYVAVEAADERGKILPGRSFADCDRISGDHLDRTITWNGESDLGHADGAPVTFRFRLRTAEVYAVRFW